MELDEPYPKYEVYGPICEDFLIVAHSFIFHYLYHPRMFHVGLHETLLASPISISVHHPQMKT